MTGQPCQHFHKHWDNKTSPKAKLMGARRLTDRRGVRRKSKSQMPLRLYPSRLVSAKKGNQNAISCSRQYWNKGVTKPKHAWSAKTVLL